MCGIIGYIGPNPPVPIIIRSQFLRQPAQPPPKVPSSVTHKIPRTPSKLFLCAESSATSVPIPPCPSSSDLSSSANPRSLPQKSHPLSLTKSPAPHLNCFYVRNHRLHRSQSPRAHHHPISVPPPTRAASPKSPILCHSQNPPHPI